MRNLEELELEEEVDMEGKDKELERKETKIKEEISNLVKRQMQGILPKDQVKQTQELVQEIADWITQKKTSERERDLSYGFLRGGDDAKFAGHAKNLFSV